MPAKGGASLPGGAENRCHPGPESVEQGVEPYPATPVGVPRSGGSHVPSYFCFEVSLLDVEPRIWRRFLLSSTGTFEDLHIAIQDAAGWGNSHLFAFRTLDQEVIATVPDGDLDSSPDASVIALHPYFDDASQCYYQYDFGDDWWHEVVLVESSHSSERFHRKLLSGERSFPPEDCGGVPGYEEFVAVLAGKVPEQHDPDEFLEWLDGWQPDRFDLAETRRSFDGVRRPRRGPGR